MSKANDLTGRTFGLLKVLRRVEDVKPGRPMWLCECRCGKSVVKSSTSLTKQNGVKSCGCLRHQKSPELIDLTDMTFGDLRILYPGFRESKDRVPVPAMQRLLPPCRKQGHAGAIRCLSACASFSKRRATRQTGGYLIVIDVDISVPACCITNAVKS